MNNQKGTTPKVTILPRANRLIKNLAKKYLEEGQVFLMTVFIDSGQAESGVTMRIITPDHEVPESTKLIVRGHQSDLVVDDRMNRTIVVEYDEKVHLPKIKFNSK